jgi:hypothetical protein
MTRFDLVNLLGMLDNDSRLILHLVEYGEFDKAMHRLREMIKSIDRLREKYGVAFPDRNPEDPQ